MTENNEFFTPKDVDERIEHIGELHTSMSANTQLVRDLRRVLPYSLEENEDAASLESVWQRITTQPEQHSSYKSKRLLKMQTTEQRIKNTGRVEKRSAGSRISIAAAVVFLALLVGSMAYVFHSVKKDGPTSSQSGAHSSGGQGTTVYTYRNQQDGITSVSWSHDGKRILSMGNTIEAWDATTGKNRVTYTLPQTSSGPFATAWSPDNTHIAIASDAVYLVNTQTQKVETKLTYSTSAQIIKGGAQSDLSLKLASSNKATTNTLAYTAPSKLLDAQIPTAHGGPIFTTLTWSPDNKYIAASYQDTSSNEHPILVWNAVTGNRVASYTKHTDDLNALAWSPDGHYIASASRDKTVRVWNALSGEDIYTQSTHKSSVWTSTVIGDPGVSSVAWSSDSQRVASADNTGLVTEWDATTGKNLIKVQISDPNLSPVNRGISSLAWSPDGREIAAGGYGVVHIIDAATLHRTFNYTGNRTYVSGVAWSPDGREIASCTITPTSSDKIPDTKAYGTSTVNVWQA